MEQSSNRLYTGPLSQAALKILAVLRAQNPHEARGNQHFSAYRQIRECTHSHPEHLTQSSCNAVERKDGYSYWHQVSVSTSNELQTSQTSASHQYCQTPASSQPSSCWDVSLRRRTPQMAACSSYPQTSSDRICSEPPANLSIPTLSFSQQVSCHEDRYSSSLQIPGRHAEHQVTLRTTFAGEIRPSFIPLEFPDEEGPNEMFEPPTEEPYCPPVACRTPSSCPDACKETVNTSVVQNEEKAVMNVDGNEPEDNLGSRLKSKQTTSGVKHGEVLYEQSESNSQPPSDHTVVEGAERDQTEGLVQSELTTLILELNRGPNLEKMHLMSVVVEDDTDSKTTADYETTEHMKDTGRLHRSDILQKESQREISIKEDTGLPVINTEAGQTGKEREVELPRLGEEQQIKSAENSDGKQHPVPRLSQARGARRSGFKPPCLLGNQKKNAKNPNESSRGSTLSIALIKASELVTELNSSSPQDLASPVGVLNQNLETKSLHVPQSHSHHPPLIPSFPQKRKHDVFQHRHANPPPKLYQTIFPPKWQRSHSSQEKTAEEEGVSELKKARPENPTLITEPLLKINPCVHSDPDTLEHTRQSLEFKVKKTCVKKNASKRSSLSKPCKDTWAKCRADASTDNTKRFHKGINTGEPQNQPKTGSHPTTLTSDSRVKDSGQLNPEEKLQILEETGRAQVVLLTMVLRDGTTQLDPEQKVAPAVCGLLVLMKNDLLCNTLENTLRPNDSLVYLTLEHTPLWAQQPTHHSQELFTRDVLLRVLSRSQLVVCYKAKDLLRTALQYYNDELSWKQVAGCQIQDPQVSGWLLDPTNPSSCYNDLLYKHCQKAHTASFPGAQKVSQIISSLNWLYKLNLNLCAKLQSQRLWDLYSEMELRMIPVLAAMESHCIHVDKDALKRTSDLLGVRRHTQTFKAKIKQLEQEAHRAAGQIFLLTSSTQLRTVLFDKLHLHERCKNKKLPKTINKQQQSTSEAALLQLQDLHPLPKIILEYRQIHKIKSTFVDGILSCMKSKSYISSTWYQTSVVTGRISAKHPNFQALPRQPLQIFKTQYSQGKEKEVVAVHPRAMFIPQEGWTFLAADFCQVELRLLAHFSSDPELLRIFANPRADVFTMLASQWKGVSVDAVTSEDREHAKRIVYSVVYGAGRERLSGILGVSAEQASQFQNSFLQTFREVQTFIQRTIQQSHKQGYVLSVMGRRRNLPNINSPDWAVRMQAERQAVNFVVQGSAADLCKTAMIRIFDLVSSSSSLSARLLAQLHDELLYEVEDSQVEQFAALVRSIMESLQHIDHLGVHLKVPLKVAVSCGKSWGSMSELHSPLPPSAP